MRAPGSSLGVIQDPEPPKDLPPRVSHGSAAAYQHYRCRCDACQEWRRAYDRRLYAIKKMRGKKP